MYFLNVLSPANKVPDLEGSDDLQNLEAAIAEAVQSARELWSDGILKGQDRRDWAIEIADDTGEVLRVIRFAETAVG